MKIAYLLLLLAALSSVLFFTRLGGLALTEPDETFYAQTAKEMLAADDWVTPRIFGKPQFEKPVLYYWLVMASYTAFGISEFSARFPSAVFSIFGVFGVFLLGKLLYSRLTGFLSAVVIATSIIYIVVGKACVTDTVLTVFILYTFYFFMAGWSSGKRLYYYAASASAALAVLTKGPIGLFIAGAVVLLYLAFTGEIRFIFKKVPIFKILLFFLAIALPWYVLAYWANGNIFIDEFFGFHNITRFTQPEHKIGDTPFFYLPVAIGGIFPWSVFFPFAAWCMYKKNKDAPGSLGESKAAIKAPKVFLAAWFLLVLLFFSISRTKLVTYILPLFPAMALITGRFWEKAITGYEKGISAGKQMKWAFGVSSLITLLGLCGLGFFLLQRFPYRDVFKGFFIGSGAFIVSILAGWYFLRQRKILAVFLSIAFSVVLVMPAITVYIFPVIEKYESRKALALKVKELAMPNEKIGAECDHRRGIAFYSDRVDIEDIDVVEKQAEFFSRKERVWGVLKMPHYNDLKERLKENSPIVVKRSGKHVLLTNIPTGQDG
jgi:4-amino-4-deoxy-L-arabinose transferase-like glycosyltransferase